MSDNVFTQRVMFPLRNSQGQTIGFSVTLACTRKRAGKKISPNTLNSPETELFVIKHVLLNLDKQERYPEKTVGRNSLVVRRVYGCDCCMAGWYQNGLALWGHIKSNSSTDPTNGKAGRKNWSFAVTETTRA